MARDSTKIFAFIQEFSDDVIKAYNIRGDFIDKQWLDVFEDTGKVHLFIRVIDQAGVEWVLMEPDEVFDSQSNEEAMDISMLAKFLQIPVREVRRRWKKLT